MIRITKGFNLGEPATVTMFEDRKRLFIDMLLWDVPVVDGRFEIDAFDGPHATYIVAHGDDGEHVGSMRLLPTTRPHILGLLFPSLCDHGVPVGDAIFEITRLCLPQRLGAAGRQAVRNRLISAMADHAIEAGIASLTGVVSSDFRERVLRMGWRCAVLGAPAVIGGQRLGAFRIDLDGHTRTGLAQSGIYTPNTIAVFEACDAA